MSFAVRRAVAAVIIAAPLSGCMPTIESMRMTPTALEPRPVDHPIRLYTTTRPRCPVEEVGLLSAEEVGLMRHELRSDFTADLLRVRARRLGGDAIIGLREVVQDEGHTTTQTVSRSADSAAATSTIELKTDVSPNRTRRLDGVVVRFTRNDCRD